MKSLAVIFLVVLVVIGVAYYYKSGSVTSIVENVKNKVPRITPSTTYTGSPSGTVTSNSPGSTSTQTIIEETTNTGTYAQGQGSLQDIKNMVVRDASKIKFSYKASIVGDGKFSLSLSWVYDGPVFYLDSWDDKDLNPWGQHIGFYDRDLNALYDVDVRNLIEMDVFDNGDLSSDMYTVYLLPDNVHPVDFRLISGGFNHGLVVLNESGDILLYPVDFSQYKIGPLGGYVSSIVFLKYMPFMQSVYPVKNYTLARHADGMDIQESCGNDDYRMSYFRLYYWNTTVFVIKSFNERSISDIVQDGLDVKLIGEEKTYNLEKTELKVADVYGALIGSACSIIETSDSKLFITVPINREAPLSPNNTIAIGPVFEDYKSIAIKDQGFAFDEPFGIFALMENNSIIFHRGYEYNVSDQMLSYYAGTVKLDKQSTGEPVMIKFNSGVYPYSDALLAVVDDKNNIYIYNITVEEENSSTYVIHGKLLFKTGLSKQSSRLGFDYVEGTGNNEYSVLKNVNGGRTQVTVPEGTVHFVIAYSQLTSSGEQIVYNITYGIQPGS